ncbi:N-acetylmuramoyl-L-alanine amidase [Streptomyces sp. NPDC059787]|uniref:N-acetylmuramoyl-L-alanine amidase n=1 Tax=Streptomyces sp. NPDC059787 TaxID=3346947 RepID=UPI00365576C9
MATPLDADRALAVLKAAGLDVREVRSWRTHNRDHKGPWGPMHGVMIHHTGAYSTESGMVSLCYNGHSTLPGPLCQSVIDRAGAVHMVGWGRANHAGSGDSDVLAAVKAERSLPVDNEADTDGNRHFYGAELINHGDGKQAWPAAQVEAAARWAAALCRAHGWNERSVIGHKEWQPGKPDPRGIDMDDFRARVAQLLDDDAEPTTPEKPTAPSTRPKPKPTPYRPPAFPAGLAPGKARPSAKALQRALRAAGFLKISDADLADAYGPRTQAAVAKFHNAHPQYRAKGVTRDVKIGPRGWAHLFTLAYGRK